MAAYVVPIHRDWHRLERCGLDTRFCYGLLDLDSELIEWDAYYNTNIDTDQVDDNIDGPIFRGFLSREPGSISPFLILTALMETST